MKTVFILSFFLLSQSLWAQGQHRRALFVGNSYTYYNNLPTMIASMATSTGDTLTHDGNNIGGYTFQNHVGNTTSTNKIALGTWDFVVLQEQSQAPSFPIGQVQTQVFPYARALDSLINLANPCTETVFYTTWGRENGDAGNCANFTPLCTYVGMDSLLQLRYGMMADDNAAVEAPVAAVWRYLRANTALDLYDTDGSHPSLAGSYVAGCTFYAVFFRKDPTLISYDAGLGAVADTIRAAAKLIVFDDLARWRVGNYDVKADFSYSFTAAQAVNFNNMSTYADSFYWNFGDGSTSTDSSPTHIFPDTTAVFNVQLIATRCGKSDTTFQQISTIGSPVSITEQALASSHRLNFSLSPNPTRAQVWLAHDFSGQLQLEIFDVLGRGVLRAALSAPRQSLDVSALPAGVYIVRLLAAGQLLGAQKLIID